jgi:hypothetical protein
MVLSSPNLTQGAGIHMIYSFTHLVLYMLEFSKTNKMKGSPSDDIFFNIKKKNLSAFEKQNLLLYFN